MTSRNVTKNLVTAEDILHGVGTISQVRANQTYDLHKVDIAIGLSSTAELASVDPIRYPRARVGNTEFEYINGAWQERLVIAPYVYAAGVRLTENYNQVITSAGTIARYEGTLPYTVTGSEDLSSPPWSIIGGGSGGGSGGGVEYDIPTSVIEVGKTFFNPESFSLSFSYSDLDSTQYVTFPLLGSALYSAGGSGVITLANSAGTGSTLLKTLSSTSYEVKRLKAGANITLTDDGNAITINSSGGGGGGATTTLSNAGAIGLPLVGDLVGADYPIKRLEAGANVTITDNGTYYTIAAASGGGSISDGNKGDITVSGTGAVWTLNSSGVVAGTYNNNGTQVRPFTVDAKGRITSVGAAVNIAPAFSSLTSKPTTLGGYGITDAQPLDATLTALAALTTAANQIAYSTGSDAFAMTSLTALARNLIAAATTSNMLATLGIAVTTNANGISLRIPTSTPTSGIQLCFTANLTLPAVNVVHGVGFTSNALSWTFPQAFSGVPYYNFSCDGDNNIMISGAGAATTSAACRGKAFVSVGTTTPTFAFAIGTY